MSTLLLDIAEVRQRLGWPAERDDEVRDLILDLQVELEERTSLKWVQFSAEERRFPMDDKAGGGKRRIIRLPALNLSSVVLVGWYDWEIEPFDYSDPLTEDTDYDIILDRGFVEMHVDYHYVKAQFAGGYTFSTLPRVAKRAMLFQIQYLAARESGENIISETRVVEKSSAHLRKGDEHPMWKRFLATNRRRFA